MHHLYSAYPPVIAEEFVRVCGPFAVLGSQLYHCKNNLWKPIHNFELKREVAAINKQNWFIISKSETDGTEKKTPLVMGAKKISEVAELVELTVKREMKPGKGLGVQNGYLTVEGIRPAVDENFCVRKIDIAYDDSARCPEFLEMLQRVFEKDPREWRESKINTLQEFYGAALFGLATQYPQALILLGDGKNGKSTVQNTVLDAVFKDMSCAIPPSEWDNRTMLAELANKSLNSLDELDIKSFTFGTFKAILSGEITTARRLYGHPFKFVPVAGHIFATNELPQVNDVSDGFFRRIIILRFTNRFNDQDGTKQFISSKIAKAEGPGILNWCLEGARRLLANNKYAVGEWHQIEINNWKLESSSLEEFIKTHTQPSKTLTTIHTLHRHYVQWCMELGVRAETIYKMGRRLNMYERKKPNGIPSYECVLVGFDNLPKGVQNGQRSQDPGQDTQ